VSTEIVRIKSTGKVSKTLQTTVQHKIGSTIVVEKGKPVGILTRQDASTRVAKAQNVPRMTIRKIMPKPLVTARSSAEVW
jgi:CBS domain-containing protein